MPESADSQTREEGADIVELIVFRLGDEEFSAAIDQVREVITKGVITPVPDSPPFVTGVTNVRGEVTLVVDLRARFGLPMAPDVESKHIVITRQERNLFGLMADEVTQVLRIPRSQIKPAPEPVTKTESEHIKGVLTIENRLILLLDLDRLLSEEGFAAWAEGQVAKHAPVEPEPEIEAEAREEEADAAAPPEEVLQAEAEAPQPVGAAAGE